MTYAFRAAGTVAAGNNTSTGSLGMPAGVVAGDLLLAFVSVATGGSGSTAPTVSAPSGFTQLGSTVINQTTTAGITGAWYYRWATGTDTAPTWSFGSTFKYAACVVAYSGGPGSGVPAITTGLGASGGSTTTNTTSTVNCGTTPTWTVEFYSSRSTTNASYTTPSGTTLRASGFGSGGAAADLLIVDSGGTVTGTDGNDTTTAGTAATWALNAIIELPPPGVAVTSGAAVTVTAGATDTTPSSGWSFRAAGTAKVGNNTSTGAVALPAGIQIGDLMLAFLSVSQGGTGFAQPTVSTPSGWNQLGSTLINQDSASGIVGAWYYRYVDGNDTGPSWTFAAGTNFKHAAAIVAYSPGSGSSSGAPVIAAAAGAAGSTTTTTTSPSISTGGTSTWLVDFYSERSTTNTSWSGPSGRTQRVSAFGAGGAASDLLIADSAANVTGTVGSDTATAGTSTARSIAASVLLPALDATTTSAATVTVTAAATVTSPSSSSGAATATLTAAASCSPVSLTATAAVALQGRATATVAPIAFRAAAHASGNSTSAATANPAGVQTGDLLLVALTIADGGTGFTTPATPTPSGYTLLGTITSQSSSSGAVGAWFYRWATGSDTAPTVALGAQFKWAMATVAYSGGDGFSAPQIVTGIDPQTAGTSHRAENITPTQSTWVVETFGVKSASNGSYTTPAGLTQRTSDFAAAGGAADIVVFDTASDVSGKVGGDVTAADTASTFGVHASIAIPPKGSHPQAAGATVTLTGLAKTTITNATHSMGWGISYPVTQAETALGRPVDFIREYGWIRNNTPTWLNPFASTRRLIVSMKFRTGAVGVVPSTDVTSGLYDTDIIAFCTWFNNLPTCPLGPHILVFEHEIDAATAQSSGTVAQLNAAFAHCAAIARARPGWSDWIGTIVTGFDPTSDPNTVLYPNGREPAFIADYNISDVVGIDLPYVNGYPGASGDSIVGPAVDWFTTNYPTMPLFIGEWGAVASRAGTPSDRPNWISAFEASLTKNRYRNVIGAMYWNQGQYALDSAGMTAWAAGGQRAQGPIGGDANVTVTATAGGALTFPGLSADASVTLTASANVSSSTGATRPAAILTLTAAAIAGGPTFALTGAAAITLTGAVGAPPAFNIDSGAATLTLQASAAITFSEIDGELAGAFITLSASALGPAAVGRIVPVDVRVRITSTVNAFDMDISSFVSVVDIVRGRSSALESSIAAATCTLTLDDSASTFDPDNTQSPLYGYLVPGWQSATTLHVDEYVSALGAYEDLFCGGLQGVKRTFTAGVVSESTAVFVDQTFDLSKHKLAAGTVLPAELPGARIARILGLPARTGFMWTSRSQSATTMQLDRGQKMLAELTCDGSTSSWDYAQKAAAAEGGLLYFDAAGVLNFSGQQDRLTSNVVWHLGDQPGMTPVEVDLAYETSTDSMILDAAVTLTDGTTQLYGPAGASFVPSGTTVNADATEQSQLAGWNSAASRAQYVYVTQSKPRRNAPTVTLEATPVVGVWTIAGVPTAYQIAVMARISDLCALSRTPQGGGDTILANYWVEGMHITIAAGSQFTATLNISRADSTASGTYWRLGISRLGIDTTLTW